jgi:hypothetical protein
MPSLHRTRVRGRHDWALVAVAEGTSVSCRSASDQQRGGHHQLRDAAVFAAAARFRPRSRRRRQVDGQARPRRRAGDDARRASAHARRRDGRDRGCRGADLDRRHHGRCALGGPGRDKTRADGGRQLERAQHPQHLVGIGPAQRGLLALREGACARAVHIRAGACHTLDDRAVRRACASRNDRHCARRCAATADPLARAARTGDSGYAGGAHASGRDPARTRLRGGGGWRACRPASDPECKRARGNQAGRCAGRERTGAHTGRRCGAGCGGAACASRGRNPRGRPDRGGRPHPWTGRAAGDAAGTPWRIWPPLDRSAAASPRGRRARRPRPVRGGRLDVHRTHVARPPAAARGRSSPACPRR